MRRVRCSALVLLGPKLLYTTCLLVRHAAPAAKPPCVMCRSLLLARQRPGPARHHRLNLLHCARHIAQGLRACRGAVWAEESRCAVGVNRMRLSLNMPCALLNGRLQRSTHRRQSPQHHLRSARRQSPVRRGQGGGRGGAVPWPDNVGPFALCIHLCETQPVCKLALKHTVGWENPEQLRLTRKCRRRASHRKPLSCGSLKAGSSSAGEK